MAKSSVRKPFPIHRYVYDDEYEHYWPYGDLRADNLLNSVHGVREPNLLLLGCGDLMSCFYSLWKNFRSGVTNKFDGVNFVVNDLSAAVLARNVLFLYLCLKMPQEQLARRKWIASIWAIWFSHELLPEHQKTLDDTVSRLLDFSKSASTWSSLENPLREIVKFTSYNTMSELRKMWYMWYRREINLREVEARHKTRQAEIRKKFPDVDGAANCIIMGSVCVTLMPYVPQEVQKVMKSEVIEYIETGITFAETVFVNSSFVAMESVRSCVNLTFFEHKDGKYTVHYGLVPYKCFDHTINFSKRELLTLGVSKATVERLLVNDVNFDSHPILSNSLQQFSLWLMSSAETLIRACTTSSSTGKAPPITFTFHCSDALDFCIHLQTPSMAKNFSCVDSFDVIYTSTLIDNVSAVNLLLSALPLVKPGSLIFTISRMYKYFIDTIEEYLYVLFRVDIELLPVIFGLRCFNHEGDNYTSGMMAYAEPYEYNHLKAAGQWRKVVIFEKVDCLPLKHPSLLESCETITKNLCDAVCTSTTPLLLCQKGHTTVNHQYIETAMLILRCFASRVEADVNNYVFWKPLVTLLSKRFEIKPYMHCLQTQALLHGIHIHLTVNERTCPVCLSTPLTQYISQIRVSLDRDNSLIRAPSFLMYVHHKSQESLPASNMQLTATNNPEMQIIDSVTGAVEGDKLILDFFLPLSFVNDDYNFTIVSYVLARVLGKDNEMPSIVKTERLVHHRVLSINYSFFGLLPTCTSPVTSFGVLVSNTGDEKSFKTVIAINEAEIKDLRSILPQSGGPNEVHLLSGSHKYVVIFPFPVSYDGLSIKLSRSQKTVAVEATRIVYPFELDKPMYVFDTSDEFSKLKIPMTDRSVRSYNGMQFDKYERVLLKRGVKASDPEGPMLTIKQSLNYMYEYQDEHHFSVGLAKDDIHILMYVQERTFDLLNRTPTIDLGYCFLEPSLRTMIMDRWQETTPPPGYRCIILEKDEMKLMKNIILFFSRRTIGRSVSKTRGPLQVLKRHKIDQYFTRAVIYPLYADPDLYVKEIEQETAPENDEPDDFINAGKDILKQFAKSTEEIEHTKARAKAINEKRSETAKLSKRHCANCGERNSEMKKCADCGKVQYCSRECQKKHWKVHKEHCKKVPKPGTGKLAITTRVPCAYCGKPYSGLRKCGGCNTPLYCCEACQRKDWKEHKKICKGAIEKASSQASLLKDCFKCGGCEKEFSSLRPCPCHKIAYCSTSCQRMDWARHKADCTATKKN